MAKEMVELCDVCLKEGEKTVAKETCYLCGKSLCQNHINKFWLGSLCSHPESAVSHTTCERCYAVYLKYLKNNQKKLKNLLELFVEPLKEQIKKEKEGTNNDD